MLQLSRADAANERTFLSWLRLSMVLTVVGVGNGSLLHVTDNCYNHQLLVESWLAKSTCATLSLSYWPIIL